MNAFKKALEWVKAFDWSRLRQLNWQDIHRLRIKVVVVLYIFCVWIGIGGMGYGSALKWMETWRSVDFSHLDVRRGRITGIHFGSITRFHLDQITTEYLIP